MNEKKFLITFPNDDTTTHYLFVWEKEVLEFASKKGINFTKFEGKEVARQNVEKYLSKMNPRFVVFNGHGDERSISGFHREKIIEMNVNEEALKSKIVYSISCRSACELGESCVKKGTEAFIGYKDDFIFPTDKNKSATPIKDELAKPYLEASNALMISILKGNSVDAAWKTSQSVFSRNFNKLLTSESPPEAESTLWAMLWDKDNQVYYGNGSAVF